MEYLIYYLDILFEIIFILLLVDVVLSYLLPPEQPIRMFLDRLVQPMLKPIRSILPQNNRLDLSPVILGFILILIRVILGAVLNKF